MEATAVALRSRLIEALIESGQEDARHPPKPVTISRKDAQLLVLYLENMLVRHRSVDELHAWLLAQKARPSTLAGEIAELRKSSHS